MKNPYEADPSQSRRVRVIGHRGWLARYPENTMVGFQAAIDLGVDIIELDVHMTADEHIVVIHDEDTYRTTGVRGSVRQMTLEAVRSLDAGSWFDPRFAGERVPTLEEVVELTRGRVGLAIEVKPPAGTADAIDRKLIPIVRNYDGSVVVHSFDAEYITDFKRKAPEICTGQLCRVLTRKIIRQTCEAGVDAVHPAWRSLTSRLARQAREAGLSIMIWTARTHRDCLRVVRKDCDAIGADCPDVLMQVMREGAGQ